MLIRAGDRAGRERAREVDVGHVIAALLVERGCIAADVLARLNGARAARVAVESGGERGRSANLPVSERVRRAVERAIVIAAEHGHRYVGTEHLLSGLLQIDSAAVREALDSPRTNLAAVRQRLAVALKSASKFPDLTEVPPKPGGEEHPVPSAGMHLPALGTPSLPHTVTQTKKKASKTLALDYFAVELTDPEGRALDPVVGRDAEIERVIHVLSRRTKNNPLLLGDPGVGKTAIVEGLAARVREGAVPPGLSGKRIYALDLPLVVAGTVYRGEFEGRLKQLIDEVKRNPDIILFVDEAHTLTGAGAATGSIDAANILKPALARGEIRMIGATTAEEYKKHIESDAALERRFQTVSVHEPDAAETLRILGGIRGRYEQFHEVTLPDETLRAAVTIAARYFPDRRFPDKAIDLMDEAAAGTRVRAAPAAAEGERAALSRALAQAIEAKEKAVRDERFDDAALAKAEEADVLRKIDRLPHHARPRVTVAPQDVARVAAAVLRVPVEGIEAGETQRLLGLETALGNRIVGQDRVIGRVAAALRRARTGVGDPQRPLASFLFLGPSGVGKTALARALTHALYDDPGNLVRLDMSEFAEPFTASKLIGAPAGYVGYRDTATLTDAVRRRPHAVVLFDEIEKAHPDVVHLLLQILEEGRLTDASGRTVSFTNAIVILTSNLGSALFRGGALGFGSSEATESAVRAAAGERLSPELMNRIDEVCVFDEIGSAELPGVVRIGFEEVAARLAARGITVTLTEEACARLSEMSYNGGAGAREVRRILQEQVENPLSELLLRGHAGSGSVLEVATDAGTVTLRPAL